MDEIIDKTALTRLARQMNTLADTVIIRLYRQGPDGKPTVITEQIPTLDIPGTRANRLYRELTEKESVKRFSPNR